MVIGRAAYDDGMLRITRTGRPPVLAISGDITEETHAGLVKTLHKLTAGRQEIQISLRDVVYCELAGLRTIIRLTGACSGADEPGGAKPVAARLVLRDVPQHIKTILEVLGWDSTPGLVIHEPGWPRTPELRADQLSMAARQPGWRTLPFAHPVIARRTAQDNRTRA